MYAHFRFKKRASGRDKRGQRQNIFCKNTLLQAEFSFLG